MFQSVISTLFNKNIKIVPYEYLGSAILKLERKIKGQLFAALGIFGTNHEQSERVGTRILSGAMATLDLLNLIVTCLQNGNSYDTSNSILNHVLRQAGGRSYNLTRNMS